MKCASTAALAALYHDHHSGLQSWLCGKLSDAFDASGSAPEVFVRLLARRQSVETVKPRASLVIDRWLRQELERVWLETLAALPQADAPPPESRLIFLETLIEIDRKFDAIKPAERTAFLLAQLDRLTSPPIAERLGVARATGGCKWRFET